MAVEIRVAGSGDLDALTAIMATAFRDDPVWGEYSFPGSRERLDTAAAFWRAYIAAMLRHRWSFLTAGAQAAAGLGAPRQGGLTHQQEHELEALLRDLPGDAQAGIVFGVIEQLEDVHPRHEAHHQLSLFGTHEHHRGRGIGMALLDACLERVDADGSPAYLESTNPAND